MEIKAEDSGFYARFLGGFSLLYRGNPLSLNANPQAGYMQIMLCLLKAGKNGMGRKELLAINQRILIIISVPIIFANKSICLEMRLPGQDFLRGST